MNKKFILLLLLMASIKGRVVYTPFRTNFHSISRKFITHSLSEIIYMDMDTLDCSHELIQVSQSIKAWQEILENEKKFDTDIQSLKNIQASVKEFRQLPDQRQIYTQIKTSVLKHIRQVGVLDLSHYQQWRKQEIEGLQEQLDLLDQARSIDESQACCDRKEKLIEMMLSEREKIKQQLQQPQININIINIKANQVSKKQEACEAQGVKLDGIKDKDKIKNKKIHEKSKSVVDFEQDEEVDKDAKKKNSKNKSSKKSPLIDKQINVQQHLQEYGYGFWFRFLTIYPKSLPNGNNLLSGLTTKEPNENIQMGDRTLVIWQGQGNYIFVSCNKVNVDPNAVGSINYPADIEAVWTYIYYSYSVEHQKAVGFIKFGEQDFQTVVQPVTHPKTNSLRFILAGNYDRRYPKLNGQFTREIFNDQLGAYIAQIQILQQLVASQGPAPSVIALELISRELVDGVAERYPTDEIKVIQVTDARLPHEYAISGWFKFVQPSIQADWHSAFRVQVTTPGQNGNLGDRVLMYELGKSGDIWTSTYTYSNMNGAGTANLPKTAPHQNRHYQWHFVYQGYSKTQSLAYFIAKFINPNSQESFQWTDIKHYYQGQFHILLGSTHYLQGWSGQHAFVSFHTGEGAFKVGNDYQDSEDRFKQIAATNSILNLGYQKPTPTTYPALLESKSSQEEPLMDKQINVQQNYQEYGYGFWLRFLTIYPQRLPNGKNLGYYFVSRLTINQPYGDSNMGDRTLLIMQAQGFYEFCTSNIVINRACVDVDIVYPDDIEGVWTYIYYSHSVVDKKTVGFIKFGDQDFQTFVQSVTHPDSNYFRFILGGNDAKRYPGFNGLFTRVIFNDQLGAYISQLQILQQLVDAQGPAPSVSAQELISRELVDGVAERYPTDEIKVIQVTDARLPHEYAISGWFKFVQPSIQADWHSAFRVQVTTPGQNGNLGDRVLMYEFGKSGDIWTSTYTYSNMNGAGTANIPTYIPHQNRPYQWHFVYQGYSKTQSLAYFIAKFINPNSQESFQWTNTKHYYPGQFHILLGSTHYLQGWSGQHAFVSFHTGEGAFKVGNDYGDPQDRFKQIAATNSILNLGYQKPTPTTYPALLESKSSQEEPLMDQQINVQQNYQEYGYGFWLRFLTIYPQRLRNGKNLGYYFVSRLTINQPYGDANMGDRTLLIMLAQGFYEFCTSNIVINRACVDVDIVYPDDIEGVWTYIYYSHSVVDKKTVGFIKFGDQDFQTFVQSVTHPDSNYFRFILGGNDAKRYPGFNGLFTRVIFNDQLGAYISQLQILQQLVDAQGPAPSVSAQELISRELVDGVAERYPTDEIKVIQVTDARLPHEYAISGWFKFVQPSIQADWHSAFRVQVTTPGQNGNLGDRVLMYEFGKSGDIWTSTYTYSNMNGAGTANIPTYIPHQNRPYQWHFVYQGYSKTQSLAYFIAKFINPNSQESFQWTNTKHYYPGQFHILLGSTHYLQGWSGQHAFVSFHTGEGAFKVGNDYGDPQDRFKQIAATNSILNLGYQKPTPTTYPALLESKSSQEEPLMDQQISVQQNYQEYGYGFWLRFLTIYPQRLRNGKNLGYYFVSRLTINQPYGDANMGDRTLLIMLAQGFYEFCTSNIVINRACVDVDIVYPDDIEGVWTYIYYSHSVVDKKTVGFIKFGDQDFQTFVQSVTHPDSNYFRFILGGNDAKRYPGFNGLFTRVIFNDQLGAYISQLQILQQLVDAQGPAPSVSAQELISRELVDGVAERYPTDEIKVIQVTDARLPHEYAISGWFKFVQPSIQANWHSAFRVQVTTPGQNGNLGDRVLMYELGKSGQIWTSTYTYSNMNGAGTASLPKTAPHQNRPYQWHFVYQGYSKPQSLAYFIAKFINPNSQESFQWTNTKHYYPGQFHILLGSTHYLQGWSGQHAFVSFHTGEGAFKVGNDYGDPQDRFKQIAATNSIFLQSLSTIQKQKKCQSSLMIDCPQQ